MNARPAFKAFVFLLLMLLLSVGLAGCIHDDDDDDAPPPPPPSPAASSDADLSALSVSAGTLDPAFSPDVTDYAVTVGNEVTEISVTATASDDAATLTVDGAATDSGAASAPIALAVGTGQVDIVVTAEDGTTKTYSIAVTREPSSDASLSALELSAATLNETFDPATTAYTADVENAVESTTVTATASDDAATLEIDGTAVDSGAASQPIALAVGDNAITVAVTAEDGTTTETYTITVTRAEPPVLVSSVELLVLDDSGRLVEGAAVRVESSGDSATTDAEGRATVPVVQQSRELIRVTAPGYLPQTLPVSLPADANPSVFTVGLIAEADPVQIAAAENGGTATGGDGASVTLPPGALVDGAGQTVTGPVDVFITPLDVSDERAFTAFPGGFEAENAAGDSGFMLSYGTVDFRFEQNGEVLSLADGQTATIEIPIYVENDSQGVPLAEGAAIALWSLDETTSLWLEEGQGTVVTSASSPTGFALRGEATHFSWWNCDDFRRGATIDIRGNCEAIGFTCDALPEATLVCGVGGNGGPRTSAQASLSTSSGSGGASEPLELPVPADTDVTCAVEVDGAFTAETVPDPINTSVGTPLPVEVIFSPRHLSTDPFTPGERLRGEMTSVGEIHTWRFNGFAGEIFRVTAYPAADATSEPGLTGNLGASVSVYQGTTLLGSANFESTIAGEVEVTLPADGEYEVRFEAQGKVPGWYVATTRISVQAATGDNLKVAFLAYDRSAGSDGRERLFTVPNGASPYLELSSVFPDDFDTEGVRTGSSSLTPLQTDRPFYQEVSPGRIVYLADHDVPGKFELYMVEVANPGVTTKLNGAETGDATVFTEISDFQVSPADPTRIVYWVGGEDAGTELWFVDTDDPGNSVRLGEPTDDPLYDGNQYAFAFAGDGNSVVYQAGSTADTRLYDGGLYLVSLDAPAVATRLSAPVDNGNGETISAFIRDWYDAVSPDGSLVAYKARLTTGEALFLVPVADPGNAVRISIEQDPSVDEFGFTPDGSGLLLNTDDWSLWLVDVTDPAAPSAAVRLSDRFNMANVDTVEADRFVPGPDSSSVLFPSNQEMERIDFDTPFTAVTEWSYPQGGFPERLRFTPDGTGVLLQIEENGIDQLYYHPLGGGADVQTRVGPQSLANSDWGVTYFDIAPDGDTVYYVADLVFREAEIFSTTLSDPDGDRVAIAERLDSYPIAVPVDQGLRLPLFIILEAGRNPAP